MQAIKETDRQLRDLVIRQLESDPQVTSPDVSVAAADNTITLTGFVHSYAEKYAAEKAARSVCGVQAVANDIEVRAVSVRTDPEIARDVARATKIDTPFPGGGLQVIVQNGFVTLEGMVEWNFQRTGVEACTRKVPGVRGVMNRIAVRSEPVSIADVLRSIEDTLHRNRTVDARQITVSVDAGRVNLYGSVHSRVEREEAERAAWAAPGVIEVIDHISVVP